MFILDKWCRHGLSWFVLFLRAQVGYFWLTNGLAFTPQHGSALYIDVRLVPHCSDPCTVHNARSPRLEGRYGECWSACSVDFNHVNCARAFHDTHLLPDSPYKVTFKLFDELRLSGRLCCE